MFRVSLSLLFIIGNIANLISASPTHLLPRTSDSDQLDTLCKNAIKAYKPDSYYLSKTTITKKKSVGASRVGPRTLACTAFYECKTEQDYYQGRTGESLINLFDLHNSRIPDEDWHAKTTEAGVCEIGVKRRSGFGITIPADIGGPSDKPGKVPAPGPLPTVPSSATTSKIVSTVTATASTSSIPAIPIASVFADVDVAQVRIDELLQDAGNEEKKRAALNALSKALKTITGATKGAGKGLFSMLTGLFSTLSSIESTLIHSPKKLTENDVAKIKTAKEDIEKNKEDVKNAAAKESSTRKTSTTRSPDTASKSSTSAGTSATPTSLEEECQLPTGPAEPLTFTVLEDAGKWGYHAGNDLVPEDETRVLYPNTSARGLVRRLERYREISICGEKSSDWYAPPYESWHKTPPPQNPYSPYFTHIQFGCGSTIGWRLQVSDNGVAKKNYGTEHVYELQLLDWFLWYVGWNHPASKRAYPDKQEDTESGKTAEQLSIIRASRFCDSIKKKLLVPGTWTNYRFFADPMENNHLPIIKRLVEQMSSHERDAANPTRRELMYLNNELNNLKMQLFGFKIPSQRNRLDEKINLLAKMSSLFEYLNDDRVAYAWARVSRRVLLFYSSLDEAQAQGNWGLGSQIAWAQSYTEWEAKALRHLAERWREFFTTELNAALVIIKREAAAGSSEAAFYHAKIKALITDQNGQPGQLSANRINLEKFVQARSIYPD